ncbi:hypothetical protein F5Y19DRAFT_19816 [Xylariaceae sp. FL1651]|nr:hypothetical protein F5Y19DRAFT_19816 [Xylariaceae sp. FL1651]
MDYRRPASDTSSYYSGSAGSIWSASDSDSFVYTDDPYWSLWGYEGVRGAVTRKVDRRDDQRTRLAAHFLRGPFAGHKSKKRSSHRDSDSRSDCSSRSGSSSSSRRHMSPPRGSPPPMGMPPPHFPGSPHQRHHHPQQFNNFQGGPPGPPPPMPPPSMAGPPPMAGFADGFIQLGGNPHVHNATPDPVWSNDMHYDGGPEPEVWD